MRSLLEVVLFSYLLLPGLSWAKKIQILHTNDLHSHFTGYPYDREVTVGYLALKKAIDHFKEEGLHQGMESLVLDGGDFAEGGTSYVASRGELSFEALNLLGHDAAVLGNHDWLMGEEELRGVLEKVKPKYQLLAANINFSGNYPLLREVIAPYTTFYLNGIKIAVLGLTTDEIYYSWRLKESSFRDPSIVAREYAPLLKEGHDVVIALTHVGVKKDRDLVEKSWGIDLVVGGHSHDRLDAPLYSTNRRGEQIPIVQTGCFARYLGRLILDIDEETNAVSLVEYKLYPLNSKGDDAALKKLIETSKEEMRNSFGNSFYEEEIAYSTVDLVNNPKTPTYFGDLMAEAMIESSDADIAIHIPGLAGDSLPAGPITENLLLSSYPRVFEFEDHPYFWTLWTIKVRGLLLKGLLKVISLTGFALHVQGVNGDEKFDDLRVDGRKISWFKEYTVVMPEGFLRALSEINYLNFFVGKKIEDTGVVFIEALKEKFSRMKIITSQNEKSIKRKNFMFIPGR